MNQKIILADLTLDEMKNLIASLNEKSFRALQIYQAIHSGKDFFEMKV